MSSNWAHITIYLILARDYVTRDMIYMEVVEGWLQHTLSANYREIQEATQSADVCYSCLAYNNVSCIEYISISLWPWQQHPQITGEHLPLGELNLVLVSVYGGFVPLQCYRQDVDLVSIRSSSWSHIDLLVIYKCITVAHDFLELDRKKYHVIHFPLPVLQNWQLSFSLGSPISI